MPVLTTQGLVVKERFVFYHDTFLHYNHQIANLLEPKAPKPTPCLTFRSRDEPDIIMALSEVRNWDDFLSRSATEDEEMVYMGWDGLEEEKPCCTAKEWDSRLEEYDQGGFTGLYVRRLTDDDFRSEPDAG